MEINGKQMIGYNSKSEFFENVDKNKIYYPPTNAYNLNKLGRFCERRKLNNNL